MELFKDSMKPFDTSKLKNYFQSLLQNDFIFCSYGKEVKKVTYENFCYCLFLFQQNSERAKPLFDQLIQYQKPNALFPLYLDESLEGDIKLGFRLLPIFFHLKKYVEIPKLDTLLVLLQQSNPNLLEQFRLDCFLQKHREIPIKDLSSRQKSHVLISLGMLENPDLNPLLKDHFDPIGSTSLDFELQNRSKREYCLLDYLNNPNLELQHVATQLPLVWHLHIEALEKKHTFFGLQKREAPPPNQHHNGFHIVRLLWGAHSFVLQETKAKITPSIEKDEVILKCEMEKVEFEAQREGMDLFNFYIDDHKGLYFLVNGVRATFFKNGDELSICAEGMHIKMHIESSNPFAGQIAIGNRDSQTDSNGLGKDKRIQIRALKNLSDPHFSIYLRVLESVETAIA